MGNRPACHNSIVFLRPRSKYNEIKKAIVLDSQLMIFETLLFAFYHGYHDDQSWCKNNEDMDDDDDNEAQLRVGYACACAVCTQMDETSGGSACPSQSY